LSENVGGFAKTSDIEDPKNLQPSDILRHSSDMLIPSYRAIDDGITAVFKFQEDFHGVAAYSGEARIPVGVVNAAHKAGIDPPVICRLAVGRFYLFRNQVLQFPDTTHPKMRKQSGLGLNGRQAEPRSRTVHVPPIDRGGIESRPCAPPVPIALPISLFRKGSRIIWRAKVIRAT